jgi:twitching motility protein PilJ
MLQRLKLALNQIPAKLAATVILLLIPILVLVFQFLNASTANIRFAEAERQGIDYLAPAVELHRRLVVYRDLATAGGTLDPAKLAEAQNEAEKALDALTRSDRALGQELGTGDAFTALTTAWEAARPATPGGPVSSLGPAVDAAYDLLRRVGDTSKLILDPDLDSYYLMDAFLLRLPAATSAVSRLRARGMAAIDRGSTDPAQRAELLVAVADIQLAQNELMRGLRTLQGVNPTVYDELVVAIAPILRDAKIFAEASQRDIAEVEGPPRVRVNDHDRAGRDILDKLATVSQRTMDTTDRLLEARIGRISATRNRQILLSGTLALAGLLFSALIARGLVRQVAELARVFRDVGQGQLDSRARPLSGDELGKAAHSLNGMLDTTRRLMQSEEERNAIQSATIKLLDDVSSVAQGDLTAQAEVTPDITGAIADAFNFMIVELQQLIRQVQAASQEVNATAGKVQETTDALARGSQQQALKIAQTSAVIEAMAASTSLVSQNATSASQVAQEALVNARTGAQAVGRTIEGMGSIRGQVQETARRIKRLGESSQEIGEIVQLIGDIADRTSMLALNASIQAAAAGEAGRGFAVVAEEVERLAERSAQASKSIASLLKTIQSETQEAVTAMEVTTQGVVQGSGVAQEAGVALAQIESVSNRLAALLQSISQAAVEQAHGSEGAVNAMNQISTVTSQAATGAQRAAASLRYLTQLSDQLAASVARFRVPEKAA